MFIGNLISHTIMFLIFFIRIRVIPIVHIIKYIGMIIVKSPGEKLLIIAIQSHLILLQMFLNLVIIIGLIQKLKPIKYGQLLQLTVNLR